MNSLECPKCKSQLTLLEILNGSFCYWKELDVTCFKCEHCGVNIEMQLENGSLAIGFVYSAGAPHFSRMIEHDFLGLEVTNEGRSLKVAFEGKNWIIVPCEK